MATLGNVPAEAYTNTVKDSFSGNGSATAFTMSLPTVTNDVRVVVENVIQDPTVAYSVSGTTLTFTSAPPTGTNNIYVVHLGPAAMTAVPPAEIADATTFASSLTVQGAFTSKGIDDNADAVALTIDSSENVMVGATTSNSANVGHGFNSDGFVYHTRDGGSMLRLNRLTSDGDIMQVQKDGTTVGTIGTNGSTLYIGSTEGADAYIGFGNQIVRPVTSSGGSRDNAIDLGYNGMRFRDIYLSGGIYLGGVGSANKLEDYEEGTHQTVATMTTSGTVTLNTSFDRISYTKVGRLVTIIGNPRISTVSSPVGQLRFTLPFTAISGQTDECRAGFISNYYDNTGGSGSYSKQVNATVNEGTNHLTLDLVNSHNNNITADSSDEVLFSFSYFTTS